MRYAVAIPLEDRFLWEARVQLANFEKWKIPSSDVYYAIMLAGNEEKQKPKFDALVKEFPDVNIKFYSDFRSDEYRHNYPPTCRPHVMKQLLGDFPELAERGLFYLDSDVIFTAKPEFDDLSYTDNWYGSNVSSYIGAPYIIGRGNQFLLADMCGIVGVDYMKVKNAMADTIIGAQIIMKNADTEFWAEVEENSYKLFEYMSRTKDYWKKLKASRHGNETYNPIQAWTADMWAVLWGAWKRGYATKSNTVLDFIQATEIMESTKGKGIYHNNGIVKGSPQAANGFCKHDFVEKDPFSTNFNYVSEESASFLYVEAIRQYMKRKSSKVLAAV